MTPPLYHGYRRTDFSCHFRAAILVHPHAPLPDNRWVWRTEFFDAFPQADLAFLAQGYHLVYLDLQNLYGSPPAILAMDQFYDQLLLQFSLASKMILEGFSRGGLFALNWAIKNPEKVAGIYLDAPVCDFKSWPAGRGTGCGSPEDWERCKKVYDLSEEQALSYPFNPIDQLEPIAKEGIPIFAVYGDQDEVVPMEENIQILEARYQALGGKIESIIKPGCGHHPHSLEDPRPILDFFKANSTDAPK